MPTYEYECAGCGHAFEEFQSMSDRPLKKCPACGKRRLRRLFGTGAGIIFKGSGFYETDYKRKSPAKSESEGKGESKGESKAESKAESKSESTKKEGGKKKETTK